jgi:2,4-dienoyl-CoA reductase-like NADH-dependent reductase (Old Yellow Enzyme family)
VSYPRVASFKTAEAFRAHLQRSGIDLGFDDERASAEESPLAAPLVVDDVRVGNRFCILPMEGWDGTREGAPSDLTRRRWRHFGTSGAKLIWGGEAVAVRADGRANPNQLLMSARTQPGLALLREELVRAHCERFGAGADGDLFVGLQLTHSGRFSRPEIWNQPRPLAAVNDPLLDRRFAGGVRVLTDDEIDRLVDDFVDAAKLAKRAGFRFVDIKHCHGYLGHELLGARARQGRYGGPLASRWRFLQRVIEGIRTEAPDLIIGVRLSVFDTVPYRKGEDAVGVPETPASGRTIGFGVLDGSLDAALDDSKATLSMLENLGIRWICTTAGSPYYNPHVQRPAFFPPLDGYQPPEDPLRGVARQIQATARLKAAFPNLVFVGSAYSYLQEWLPNVAQFVVRNGLADFVGLGRVALSYPELPSDVLCGAPLRRQALCRTFSDCTTGPRMGLVSGCYPLDPFYTGRPDGARIRQVRTEINTEREGQ